VRLRHVHERVRSLWNRRRQELELEEEFQFHLSEEADERIVEGLHPDQARVAAKRDFGNLTLIREATREVRGWGSAERLIRDVRYAFRTMRRAPGFSAVAVLTLALGIGANTAIFSLVNGILLRPLPYPDPERLVSVTGTYPKGAFVELRASARTMRVAAYAEGHGFNLSGLGEPIRLTTTLISAELLSVLGSRPALGRLFQAGEDLPGRDGYAILSHALWEQRFARDPAIVGRSIVLDGVNREVVGVMPAGFRFPSSTTQIWIPLHIDPRSQAHYWAGDFMPIVARLLPGATREQARAEVRRFQARIPASFPWAMPVSWNADVNVVPLQTAVVGDARARVLLLSGVVFLVLLIACANVANLSLARAVTRAKEISIRCALGAGQARVARQLLTESVVLALVGAALGLAVAVQGLALLKRVLPPDTPRLADVHVDWRVLAFTAALAIATGLAFGLAPALHASRTALTESMKAAGPSGVSSVRLRLRHALVIVEIALAVLLVTVAGLFIRSFWTLSHVNAGFRLERVMTARITPGPGFCSEDARCLAFYRDVLDRVRASAGVNGAALVNTLPLDGRVAKRSLNLEGRTTAGAEDAPLFWLNVITPEYFRVMSIALVSGRAFTEADLSGHPPVAMLSSATARRFWTDESAIGKRIRFVGEEHWHTIVGVAGDVRAHDLRQDVPDWIEGTVYVPYSPKATLEEGRIPAEMTLAVVTSTDTSRFGETLRDTVGSLSREIPVSDVQTMRATVSDAVASTAAVTTLVVAFAGVALALGVIGIYGVLSFLVSKRTREIGIRMALGAQRGDVFRSIMKEGAQLSLAGVGLGLAAAAIVTRVLSRELYGIGPADPVTYTAVAVVMVIATLGACCVPTYRATRVDALIALRQE
jgi:putative ABC transport system permease protein